MAGYKKCYPDPAMGENETKKMITTGMLRRQVWITDDDEFNHIFENLRRVLKLNAQYENHPYVEEFPKECSSMLIYGTYVLEWEADAKFSLGEIWNVLQAGPLQCKHFMQANDKLYEGIELHTKNIRFSPEDRDHQANTQDNDGQGKASGWKRCLGGGI